MIKKMRKLSLVLHQADVSGFLDELQDVGVVHIDIKDGIEDSSLSEKVIKKRQLEDFVGFISSHKGKEKQKKYPGRIRELLAEYKKVKNELEVIRVDREKQHKLVLLMTPWGDYDPTHLAKLKEQGVHFMFYEVPVKKLADFDFSEFHLEQINEVHGHAYFAIVQDGEQNKLPWENILLPDVTLHEAQEHLQILSKKAEDVEQKLLGLSVYSEWAKSSISLLEDNIAYIEANGSFDTSYEGLAAVTGWIPEDSVATLEDFLKNKSDVVYELEEVDFKNTEEQVPIQLKNGMFSKLFEPITKLFSLPSYMEMDLTPFFAPFYAMFFGMCLGDSGYGAILLAGCLWAAIKFKDARPLAILGAILSGSTVLWGALTGTFFGVSMFDHNIPGLSDMAVFTSTHMFYLALMVGLLQILFGMLVNAGNKVLSGDTAGALGPIGWFLLVIGLVKLYLQSAPSEGDFWLGVQFITMMQAIPMGVAHGLWIAGLLGILFFNDTQASIIVRFGKGLWELYGITGVVGDLLSYIRLFALGLSSAILGQVINQMCWDLPLPLMIVFLVIGHSANLAIAGLGSFVHPLRLTFVEFYGKAGFNGGGIGYRPFKKIYEV